MAGAVDGLAFDALATIEQSALPVREARDRAVAVQGGGTTLTVHIQTPPVGTCVPRI